MRWTRRADGERFDFAVSAVSDVVERVVRLTGAKPPAQDLRGVVTRRRTPA